MKILQMKTYILLPSISADIHEKSWYHEGGSTAMFRDQNRFPHNLLEQYLTPSSAAPIVCGGFFLH